VNQQTLPFKTAEDREGLIQGLSASPRFKAMLTYLDRTGRSLGTFDPRYVSAEPPKADILRALKLSSTNKAAWGDLRAEARLCAFLQMEETNCRPFYFKIDWLGLVDASQWRPAPSPGPSSKVATAVAMGAPKSARQGVTQRPPGGNSVTPSPSPPCRAPSYPEGKGDARAPVDLDLGSLKTSKYKDPARRGPSAPSVPPPKSEPKPAAAAATDGGRWGFWGVHIEARELSEPRCLARLFEIAVARGKFSRNHQGLLEFFTLAAYTRDAWHNRRRRRPSDSVQGLFTSFVSGKYLERAEFKQPWGDRFTEAQTEWAKKAIAFLGTRGKPPAPMDPAVRSAAEALSAPSGSTQEDQDRKAAAFRAQLAQMGAKR
jgi:hypothetical protein